MSLLCIQSHFGDLPLLFRQARLRDDVVIIQQPDLTSDDLQQARGLITTMHLDQLGMGEFGADLTAFLDRGGRWFFNGHLMRPLVYGLASFVPRTQPGKAGLALSVLSPHPVFEGVAREKLGARKGVAGFYGRGHNPMPAGARAVTGVGAEKLPLDWVWDCPNGGAIFSHAGNDLTGVAEEESVSRQLAENIISWTMKEHQS